MSRILGFLGSVIVLNAGIVLAQCGDLPGDVNDNQHVELADFSSFAACLSGPDQSLQPNLAQPSEECLTLFDLEGDTNVDLADFAAFQNTFTGPIRRECFNLVFVSSTSFAPNLGSPQAYDQQCNILASAAGFNNPAGTAFVAWVSSSTSLATNRLGSARGFVRPDRVAVADTMNGLLLNNILWNPIRIDDLGNDVGDGLVLTGTQSNGTASTLNCNNWTGVTGSFLAGDSAGGPGTWTHSGTYPCSQGSFRIYCVQKSRNKPLAAPRNSGKIAYVSDMLFTPGGGIASADAICEAQKPVGVGPVMALVATANMSAASRMDLNNVYVRVDGQVVGTGVELATAQYLRSGIWQTGSGAYVLPQSIWTGSGSFSVFGLAAGTCNSWFSSSTMKSGIGGLPTTSQTTDWWNSFTQSCSSPRRLFCAER